MHSPRPFGLLQYGEEISARDLSFISGLVQKCTNFKDVSNLPSVKAVRALPDGGYVIVSDMGGNLRVITHKPKEKPKESQQLQAFSYIPMLFSGRVVTPTPVIGDGVTLQLTTCCRRRLENYKKLAPSRVTLQRFEIEHNDYFRELMPKVQPIRNTYTQYVNQRPTWYSGAMAEVVQIVGGFGITDIESLPDEKYERATISLPKKVMRAIEDELSGAMLPAYSGVPDKAGQFQYDYKFERTECVGFAEDGSAYLVRITRSNVWAMPLPLIPATTTDAFYDFIDENGDDELKAIVDRFGGIPSGENFPSGEDFDAWQKAGVIMKIGDTADFYDHLAFYSACGWSANLSGTEIVNTCYSYEDSSGWAVGRLYTGRMSFSALEKHAYFPENKGIKQADKQQVVRALDYASRVLALFDSSNSQDLAVQYKVRRADIQLLINRANGVFNDDAEKKYWQDLELEPIAKCTSVISLWRCDYLYHNAKPKYQPQIKFPEPFLGGCVQHDFSRADMGVQKREFPDMDCPMFAYYIGDDLKTVNYFKDWQDNEKKDPDNNYTDCMIVGEWEQTEYLNGTQLAGNFYTADFDGRQEIAPNMRYTHIVGEDKGYDHTPFFRFAFMFSRHGTMWRNRYFTHHTNSVTNTNRRYQIGACVPFYCRNVVLYAERDIADEKEEREYLELYSIRDPNSYGFWTYDFNFAWIGTLYDDEGKPKMEGSPYPKEGNPVWVSVYSYNPSLCSDFADRGDWVGGLPADYTWLIHPDKNVWADANLGGPPFVETFSESNTIRNATTGKLSVSIAEYPFVAYQNKEPNLYYFIGLDGVFYRDGEKIVFGNANYASISEIDDKDERYHSGASKLADLKMNSQYIGVINE